METKVNLVDLFADLEIDDSIYDELLKDMLEEKAFAERLKYNPNSIVLWGAYNLAATEDPDKGTRSHRAWLNFLKLLFIEFMRDPYWNSRLGHLMWYLVCYAKYDSYYPMAWCFHYTPSEYYREGEPQRPKELETPLPYDPFNIKGDVKIPEFWWLKSKKVEGASNETSLQ